MAATGEANPAPSLTATAWAQATNALEANLLPDFVLRRGIRTLLKCRLDELSTACADAAGSNRDGTSKKTKKHPVTAEGAAAYKQAFVDELRNMPVAIETRAANEQHYEVPTAYYDLVLGPRKKYSACIYPKGDETLAQAEELAFEQVCERAQLADGMEV